MRRSTLILFVLSILLVNMSFGQTYNYPKWTSQAQKDVKITKVIRDDNSTQIFFEYLKYEDITFHILLGAPNSTNAYYILANNIKYKLVSTSGIANVDGITRPQKGVPLLFSATFEAIPKSITEFDLIEGSTGSWHFYGIKLNTQSLTSQNTNNDCDFVSVIPATPKPSFENMLAGVKHAIILRPTQQNINGYNPVFKALSEYLTNMGFEVDIKSISTSDAILNFKRSDEDVLILFFCNFSINPNSYTFDYSDFQLSFSSSINSDYKWIFYDKGTTQISLEKGIDGVQPYIYNVIRKMYQYKKPEYNPYNKIKLAKQKTCWTESSLKNYFLTNGLDNIEGIYESSSSSSLNPKYRIGVKSTNGVYKFIYLSGAVNHESWDEGEIKATLISTATQLFYKADWVMSNKAVNSDFYISFENGLINVIQPDKTKDIYIKLFPTANDKFDNPKEISGSGSGFAISSDGYIITNHHVTKGATSIKVRGIHGDFTKKYSAKVILEDKNNDLSIIKIDDPNFISLGTIPYVILNKSSDVGSTVFVLGYPLRASMGEEVKLTNGIISSKSGYQGDATSYQITVPIQPGNSGGPLFNKNGNIIGIVNAKLTGAENASYAIKSSYILNLIDLLSVPPQLQIKSSLVGLSLPEQVKVLKKFTYIIEVN